jgi:3-oxoacyl-[acyl-carrier-protein] synthase III
MPSIQIKAVEVYHPQKVMDNDFYIEHFKKQGKEIKHFIEDIMGRKKRYIIDNEKENGLTMGIEATKMVFKKANLTGEDIDMIVFATQTPEYTYPTNAIIIHNAIQGKPKTICFDSNSNCAGMTVAVEQACRAMLSNPRIHRALIVGSDFNSVHSSPTCEITFPNYGDASSALILESTNEETGFIDSRYYTDSSEYYNVLFPAEGLSKIHNHEIKDHYIRWTPFDGRVCIDPAVADMEDLLKEHGLTKDDIRAFCFSQFSWANIKAIQEKMELDMEKVIYVGDEFGYTATSSPFIALHRAIELEQIKRGDYILFWTVGTGWQNIAMLFKY